MEAFEPGQLLTVAGATPVVVVLVQFLKQALKVVGYDPPNPAIFYRSAALVFGVVLVVAATIVAGGTFGAILAALLVGVQAGAAAVATYDGVRAGVDYAALSSSEVSE